MSRLLRWLLVPLIILGGLFLIANVVFEHVAESRIASAVQDEFHLSAKPTVDVQGFPIILRVLSGSVPHMTFAAKDATFDELSIGSVTATLDDITAPGGFLASGLRVKVGSGRIEARATQSALNAYLRARGENATVTLHNGRAAVRAVRTFLGGPHMFTASGTIAREGKELVFRPAAVRIDGRAPPAVLEGAAKEKATVRVPLPNLPGGLAIYRFGPREGAILVVATLRNTSLDL